MVINNCSTSLGDNFKGRVLRMVDENLYLVFQDNYFEGNGINLNERFGILV